MKKAALLTAKLLGAVVVLFLVLTVAAGYLLNTRWAQNRLMAYATGLLTQRIGTQVTVDSVSVGFFSHDVYLYGVSIDDLQQRRMLEMERLAVSLDLGELKDRHVAVEEASIKGLRAVLSQDSLDGKANYQFLIDAFKSDKPKTADTLAAKDTTKLQLTFDVRRVKLEDIHVVYDAFTKKGPMTHQADLASLAYHDKGGQRHVSIDGLHYANDNHLPRKNANKPKRGFFDTGHFDVTANLELTIDHVGPDTLAATLTKCEARDSVMGFDVRDLRFRVMANHQTAHLHDVTIQQRTTVLQFDSATVALPSKKEDRHLAYQTSTIKGKTVLQDIARPFAPVLATFTIPLELSVVLSGSDSTMTFSNIAVNTPDKRLRIAANGGITHLKEKEKLQVRFHVSKMTAQQGLKHQIIDQFKVKKHLMKQLSNLGTITYTGDIAILWKREEFSGRLGSAPGALDFNFGIDERTKYLSGNVSSQAFHLGQALGMKDIGDISCKARFKFDISKDRTAKVRRQRGGKLPIGEVSATVPEASYKKIKLKNLEATVKSDGAEAKGSVAQRGKRVDVLSDFSFTNTDALHKMKIVNPRVKFHGLSDEQKQAKAQKKQQKADQKAQKQQQKAQQKAQKKQQKAEQKQQKAAKK